MRYDVPRDYGGKEKETRREFNARFSQPTGPEAEIPDAAIHVWEWFWSLSSRRGFTDSGLQPLAFTEIDAWARRMRIAINPEEIELITAMDDAMLAASAEEAAALAERQKNKAPKPKR